jgi:hypothetical protein
MNPSVSHRTLTFVASVPASPVLQHLEFARRCHRNRRRRGIADSRELRTARVMRAGRVQKTGCPCGIRSVSGRRQISRPSARAFPFLL